MSDQPFSQPPRPISGDQDANQWAMFIHFSLFAGYLLPLAGLVLPIILWQIKKDQYPFVDIHGKIVTNWIISLIIYSVVCAILLFLVIGIFGFIILGALTIIFPIVGGIKANQGEVWEYPLTIKFIR
jgi:uncharacterized Tic20 family protein